MVLLLKRLQVTQRDYGHSRTSPLSAPSLKNPTILYLVTVGEVVEFYSMEVFPVGDASHQLRIKASARLQSK